MAKPSKPWTSARISSIASRIFFFLIVFQIPLFRVPCMSGTCTNPVQVTTSQLVASDVMPVAAVKALLYPGAIAHGLVKNMTFPNWNNLLDIYNLTTVKEAPVATNLKRLEVLAGSYFCVAGAYVGLLKPGRMSMFGTLLVIWGLLKEGFLARPASTDAAEQTIYVYPTMLLALVCAFGSVKYDIKKAMKASPARPLAKPLQSSSKSKLRSGSVVSVNDGNVRCKVKW